MISKNISQEQISFESEDVDYKFYKMITNIRWRQQTTWMLWKHVDRAQLKYIYIIFFAYHGDMK